MHAMAGWLLQGAATHTQEAILPQLPASASVALTLTPI